MHPARDRQQIKKIAHMLFEQSLSSRKFKKASVLRRIFMSLLISNSNEGSDKEALRDKATPLSNKSLA